MLPCRLAVTAPAGVVFAARWEGRPNSPATGLRFLTYSGSLVPGGGAAKASNAGQSSRLEARIRIDMTFKRRFPQQTRTVVHATPESVTTKCDFSMLSAVRAV